MSEVNWMLTTEMVKVAKPGERWVLFNQYHGSAIGIALSSCGKLFKDDAGDTLWPLNRKDSPLACRESEWLAYLAGVVDGLKPAQPEVTPIADVIAILDESRDATRSPENWLGVTFAAAKVEGAITRINAAIEALERIAKGAGK